MDFEFLLDHLSHAVLVTDDELQIEFMNNHAKTELKLPTDLGKGKKLDKIVLFRQEDREQIRTVVSDQIKLKLPVFIPSKKNPSEVTEKQAICQAVRMYQGTKTSLVFEFFEYGTATFGIQTIQNLGHMTGSLAHALSNPLAVIQINCDTLDIECSKSPQLKSEVVKQKVGKIGNALDRVSKENQKLKDLSRKLATVEESTLDQIITASDFDIKY